MNSLLQCSEERFLEYNGIVMQPQAAAPQLRGPAAFLVCGARKSPHDGEDCAGCGCSRSLMWHGGTKRVLHCKVNKKDVIMQVIKGMFWFLALCWLMPVLAGCRSVKYVPVEAVRTDSVWVDRWQRDSVYLKDSVYVNRWTYGDTVFVDKVSVKYLYRDRIRTDTVTTVREHKTEVPVPVEKPLGWWERARLKLFWWLVAVVAALGFIVAWLARRK